MAFDVEALKTKLADFLHTLEGDAQPYVDRVLTAVHDGVDKVHQQLVADEQTFTTQAIGDVRTVEQQVSDDVNLVRGDLTGQPQSGKRPTK